MIMCSHHAPDAPMLPGVQQLYVIWMTWVLHRVADLDVID
jgi:hypothetical protein